MAGLRKNLAVTLVADGANPFKVTLHVDPSIMPLRIGTVVAAGLMSLVAQGGTKPYAFVPGDIGDSSSPSGLTINADGSITGTAENVGTFEFIGEGQDSSTPSDQVYQGTFEVTIDHVLFWDQDTPPVGAEAGITFSYQFRAIGAPATTTYSITWTLGAPPWISFDTSTGLLSGTPSGGDVGGGPWIYQVTATDSVSGDSITYVGGYIPVAAPVELHLVSGLSMAAGTTYQQIAVDVIGTGIAPFLYRIDNTTLPSGIKATISGVGDTTNAEIFITQALVPVDGNILIMVSDAVGGTAAINYPINVYVPNQQVAAADSSSDVVTNPNRITFHNATVLDDGTGGVIVTPGDGGDSGGPAMGGTFYLTGIPIGDSSGDFTGGDAFSWTPTRNNEGGATTFRCELLSDSVASWASIDSVTGEVSGTFPSPGGTFYINVAQTPLDGMFAGSSAFSRQMVVAVDSGGDPYWSDVVLRLPCDETNGSQALVDAKTAITWNCTGSLATSNISPLCGPCSLVGVGNGQATPAVVGHVPIGNLTGSPCDWVFEFFIETVGSASDTAIATTSSSIGMYQRSNTVMFDGYGFVIQTGAISSGTKTHIALVYSVVRGNFEIYAAGVLGASHTAPAQYFDLWVIAGDGVGSDYYTGKLDDFRATNNTDRGYTPSGFTPPVGPFPTHA